MSRLNKNNNTSTERKKRVCMSNSTGVLFYDAKKPVISPMNKTENIFVKSFQKKPYRTFIQWKYLPPAFTSPKTYNRILNITSGFTTKSRGNSEDRQKEYINQIDGYFMKSAPRTTHYNKQHEPIHSFMNITRSNQKQVSPDYRPMGILGSVYKNNYKTMKKINKVKNSKGAYKLEEYQHNLIKSLPKSMSNECIMKLERKFRAIKREAFTRKSEDIKESLSKIEDCEEKIIDNISKDNMLLESFLNGSDLKRKKKICFPKIYMKRMFIDPNKSKSVNNNKIILKEDNSLKNFSRELHNSQSKGNLY